MIRGTTPTLRFDLPINVETLECMYITISQNGSTVIEKSLADCVCDAKRVNCRLSQADTLKLTAGTETCIQVRVKTKGGDALASRVSMISTDRILKDGEI